MMIAVHALRTIAKTFDQTRSSCKYLRLKFVQRNLSCCILKPSTKNLVNSLLFWNTSTKEVKACKPGSVFWDLDYFIQIHLFSPSDWLADPTFLAVLLCSLRSWIKQTFAKRSFGKNVSERNDLLCDNCRSKTCKLRLM